MNGEFNGARVNLEVAETRMAGDGEPRPGTSRNSQHHLLVSLCGYPRRSNLDLLGLLCIHALLRMTLELNHSPA